MRWAGTPMIYGPKLGHGGYAETLEALVNHPAYRTPLGPNQGRGVASGYWFNGGGESSATVHVNEDGTAVVATGSMEAALSFTGSLIAVLSDIRFRPGTFLSLRTMVLGLVILAG